MRIGTLFSGGLGAPEQALKQMGWEHENVFACEWDKFARINHAANHHVPDGHFHVDINDMDGKQYAGKADIIVGGSPCQDFSIAGLRAGVDGHRGQLIWQYFRIIDEVRPPVFIYENVKGMVSDKGGKVLKDFLETFRSIGYHCHAEVLNTKDYGVPQNRERIYIVGFLDHNHYHRFEYAPKMKLEKRLKDVLEDDADEKYYLSDKLIAGFATKEKRYKTENKDMGFCFKPLGGNDISTAITARYFKCGASDPYIRRPKIFERTPLRFLDRNGINTDGEYAFCVDTTNTGGVKEISSQETKTRKLTPRECFRLQGCDDTFKIAVSDSQAYKAAGNGMSVNVLEMLFRQIKKAQSNEPTNTLMDFV